MKKTLNLILMLLVAVTVSAQSNFSSALKAKADKGANVYGVVECNGVPVEGVAVSDGYKVVLTNKKGQYSFASEKKNGNI